MKGPHFQVLFFFALISTLDLSIGSPVPDPEPEANPDAFSPLVLSKFYSDDK